MSETVITNPANLDAPQPTVPLPRGPIPAAPPEKARRSIDIKIDGQAVSVPEGSTILDAAKKIGIEPLHCAISPFICMPVGQKSILNLCVIKPTPQHETPLYGAHVCAVNCCCWPISDRLASPNANSKTSPKTSIGADARQKIQPLAKRSFGPDNSRVYSIGKSVTA